MLRNQNELKDVVKVLVRDEDNRVLLIKRASSDSHGGYWETPGGGVDDTDTSFLMSAERELEEETGVKEAVLTFGESIILKDDEDGSLFNVHLFNSVSAVSPDQVDLSHNPDHSDSTWLFEKDIQDFLDSGEKIDRWTRVQLSLKKDEHKIKQYTFRTKNLENLSLNISFLFQMENDLDLPELLTSIKKHNDFYEITFPSNDANSYAFHYSNFFRNFLSCNSDLNIIFRSLKKGYKHNADFERYGWLFSFRTEMDQDIPLAKKLIKDLGFEEVESEYGLKFFAKDKTTMLEMKNIFEEKIICNPKDYPDLHRCAQTLAIGEEVNDHWFIHIE